MPRPHGAAVRSSTRWSRHRRRRQPDSRAPRQLAGLQVEGRLEMLKAAQMRLSTSACGSQQLLLSLPPTTACVVKCREKYKSRRTAGLQAGYSSTWSRSYLFNASLRCRLVPSAHPRRCSGRTELRSVREQPLYSTEQSTQLTAQSRRHPSAPAPTGGRQLDTQGHFTASFNIKASNSLFYINITYPSVCLPVCLLMY